MWLRATSIAAGATISASERVPRAFAIDPQGKYLYSAGIESGQMSAFRIDQATGKLDRMATYPLGQRPMWVLATRLGG